MQHDVRLRAVAHAIYDAVYPSEEWSPVPLDDRPQQLWFDVDRPIHVRPDRRGSKHSARRDAAPSGPAQMELRMTAPTPAPRPTRTDPAAPRPTCPSVPVILKEPMSLSFAAWLLAQTGRKGLVGELAKAAKADRLFPRNGSADDVRARFSAAGADGDAFEALDDAEREYDRLSL